MAGLFDTFTTAKRGLSVQQGAINTTSHNVANANTVGYSRQTAVSETTRPFGGMSRFDTCSVGQVGTGAEITEIIRIRDSFVDYQYREQNGVVGNYEIQSDFLSKIEGIFGEPSDEGIQKLFSEFYASYQELAKTPESTSARTVAMQKASALADALNNAYSKLENQVNDAQTVLQNNVVDINSYLDQINELNEQIRGVTAVGQTPNDLMDSRDKLIDDLSKLMGVKIDKQNLNSIDLKADAYQNASNPIDNLVNYNPSNDQYTRFSYITGAEVTGNTINITYSPLGNTKAAQETLTINASSPEEAQQLADDLLQNRILIADKDGLVNLNSSDEQGVREKLFVTYKQQKDSANNNIINTVDNQKVKGEIAGNQGVQETIKGYMTNLDKIAASLAYAVNAIQTGSTSGDIDAEGNRHELIFVNSDTGTSDTGVTAKNICVNATVLKDVSLINCGATSTSGDRDGSRAQAIANLASIKLNISNMTEDVADLDRDTFFNSTGSTSLGISLGSDGYTITGSSTGKTVDNYYKDMISTLGTDSQEATRRTSTGTTSLNEIDLQRVSISGVSLDEEMTNLIQFQHAYSANAKIISTVDELLDVVINGLKR